MRIRILEENEKMTGIVKSTKDLQKLMLSGLADKMDYADFFKRISNKPLDKKSGKYATSYVLSDGKFGNYYIDDYYFFVSYATKNSNGIQNQVRASHWNFSGFYAGTGLNCTIVLK